MLGIWWRQVSVELAGILLTLLPYSASNSAQTQKPNSSTFETTTALICPLTSVKSLPTESTDYAPYSPIRKITKETALEESQPSPQPTSNEVQVTLRPSIHNTSTDFDTMPTLASQNVVPTIADKRPTPTLAKTSFNMTVSTYRNDHGRPSLNSQSGLCQISSERIGEITNTFNHDGFRRRMEDGTLAGLGLSAWAENIWEGDGTIQTTIDSWDKSDGHRQNLLGDWQYGCGVWKDGLAVYEFGR